MRLPGVDAFVTRCLTSQLQGGEGFRMQQSGVQGKERSGVRDKKVGIVSVEVVFSVMRMNDSPKE